MTTLNFYKGESLNIIFTAYDNGTPPDLMDISGYTKVVEVFTPYSVKIVPQISDTSINSFQVDLPADQTKNLNSGLFNIVVKLIKGDEVKIGKSIPCKILDPYAGCGPEDMYVDNNTAQVHMSVNTGIINFDMFLGSTNTTEITNIINSSDQRRLIFILENTLFEAFMPEDTHFYKVLSENVGTLEYSVDKGSSWTRISESGEIDFVANEGTVVYFRIERLTIDYKSYVAFLAKAVPQ